MDLHRYKEMMFGTTLGRNSLYRLFYNLFGRFVGLILNVVIGRFYGPSILGIYTMVLSIGSTLRLFYDPGISGYLKYLIPKERENAFPWILSGLQVISLMFLFVVIIVSFYSLVFGVKRALLFGVFLSIALAFFRFLDQVFIALEKQEQVLWAHLIKDVGRLLSLFLLFYFGFGYFVGGYGSSFLLGFFLMLLTIYPFIKRVEVSASKLTLIKKSLPFLFLGVVATLLAYTDVFMLYLFRSYHDIGIYRAAYTIVLGLYGISPFVYTILPFLSRKKEKERALSLVITKVTFFGVLLFTASIVFGPPLLILLFGPKYVTSIGVVYILSPLLVVLSANGVLVSYYLASWEVKKQFFFYLGGLISNIVLDLLLVPVLGVCGAAISTLAAGLIIFTSMLLEYRKRVKARSSSYPFS